jgi:hypothetical protein
MRVIIVAPSFKVTKAVFSLSYSFADVARSIAGIRCPKGTL